MNYTTILSISVLVGLCLTNGLALDNNPPQDPMSHNIHEDEDRNDECSVCLQQLHPKPKQPIVTTPCGHTFHADCIEKWQKTKQKPQDLHDSCPMCRQPLPHNALTQQQKLFISLVIVGGAVGLKYYILPLFSKSEEQKEKK